MLPKTGQKISYADYDDGYYEKGAPIAGPRLVDNGDDTIFDRATGLMWVKNGIGAGCNNGALITWANALIFCHNLDYAGYTDWRLPNINELSTLADYSEYNPAYNTTFFTNNRNYYWASTSYAQDTSYAWVQDGYDGYTDFGNKTASFYLRPVRDKL